MKDALRHASLRQLQIFATAAESKSFVEAAAQLHLSQPAVSMQMTKLAETLELDLFEKSGRQLKLTDAGDTLFTHTQRILQALQEASEALDALKGLKHGTIKLAITTTARYYVPKLLKRFTDLNPEIEVSLEIANHADVINYLDHNQIDLAIMGSPPRRISVVSEVFAEHPYVIITAPDHPLAQKSNISPRALTNELFLCREEGSGTRELMKHFLDNNEVESPRCHLIGGNESIKQSVMAGLGIAFISRHTIGMELETHRLAILDVKNLPIIRTWNLIRPANKVDSPAAQALREFVRAEAPAAFEVL